MNDLTFRTRNALDQLLRYGGSPWSSELVDILEKLTDINDDLQNGRDPSLIRAGIAEAKSLLDKLEAIECPR
jgi:hypothetical protein